MGMVQRKYSSNIIVNADEKFIETKRIIEKLRDMEERQENWIPQIEKQHFNKEIVQRSQTRNFSCYKELPLTLKFKITCWVLRQLI